MRKFIRILTATVLTAVMVVTPVFADDIETLTRKRQEAENQVSNLEGQTDAAIAEQNELQNQLVELLSKMAELETQLIDKGIEIIKAENDLTEAQVKERSQYTAMKLRIKFMYENGNSTLFAAILGSEDLSDVINRVEYASEISTYDRNMINRFIETQEEIKTIKAQLEVEQAELEALQTQYEEQQASLNTLIEEKSAEIANFQEQLDAAIALAAEATAKETAAIEAKAAAEEAARQAAARQREQQQRSLDTGSGGSSGGGGSTYIGYNPNTGNAIVDAAYTQLGVPYVWGGSTPYVALDCSGLVQYCYACAGISIPRTSASMRATGTVINDPQPGDICWTPGHVAIYIGGGQMIEAQQDGVPVCISNVRVSCYLRFE